MSKSDSHHSHSASFPVILAILAAGLFGAATPLSKSLLRSLSPFHLAGLLYLGAAIGVSAGSAHLRGWRSPLKMNSANRWRLTGAVVCGGMLGPVLLLAGLRAASAASVSLWLNLELVATAVLGRMLFHDHLGRFGWMGVSGVVLSGVLLSVHEGSAGLWAGLLVAGACLCWGFDNHFTALIDGMTPTQSTLWKGLAAGTTNLAIGLAMQPLAAPPGTIALALLVGALSYGVSIALYITAAQGMGATRAQMLFASAPFFGLGVAILGLGESISVLQVMSGVLLTLSLVLLFRDQHQHLHAHAYLAHEHLHRHDDGHHAHVHDGQEPAARHTHWHEHTPTAHTHPHWPDIHHRHSHDKERGADDESASC